MITGLKNALKSLIDFIFPQKCSGCGREDVILCEQCLGDISADVPVHDESGFYLFDYKNPITQNIVWNIKYAGDKNLAKLIGEILYDSSLEYISEELSYLPGTDSVLVVPIPASSRRTRKTGFNHATLIAKSYCENCDFVFEDKVLIKIRDNKPQAKINDRKQRFKNVAGVFEISDSEKVRDKFVILIDDVKTTGATLEEATKVLTNAGAKKVVSITVARG